MELNTFGGSNIQLAISDVKRFNADNKLAQQIEFRETAQREERFALSYAKQEGAEQAKFDIADTLKADGKSDEEIKKLVFKNSNDEWQKYLNNK
ncbi:MAG: hypothetical protein LBN42_00920 [Oscillospiraceae bacterium]|jgi:hypothetical protein|nr:hypothetical protein [Oscillospiraceae bacterium]